MKEEKFLKLFAELLEREDSDEPLNFEDKFKNFETWNSLTALSLLSMLDDEYGVIMGGKNLREMETIQDIFDFIKANLKNNDENNGKNKF